MTNEPHRRKEDLQPTHPEADADWTKWGLRLLLAGLITIAAVMGNQRINAIEEHNREQDARDLDLQQQIVQLREDMNAFMRVSPRKEDIDRLQKATDALTTAILQSGQPKRRE